MIQRYFANLPIRTQVLSGPLLFVLLISVVLSVVALAGWRMNAATLAVTRNYSTLQASASLLRSVVDMETGLRGYALTSDVAFLEPYVEARANLPDQFIAIRRLVRDSPDQLERLGTVQAILADWRRNVAERQIQIVQSGGDPSEFVQSGEGKRRLDAIRAEIAALEVEEEQELRARLREAGEARSFARRVVGAALVGALFAFLLAARAARQIIAPVQALALSAERIGAGDLDVQVPVRGNNELAKTAAAFNTMASALAEARSRMHAQNLELEAQAQAAERARSEMSAILDSVSDAIVLFSPAGSPIRLNHRFEELFGLRADEYVGAGPQEVRATLEKVFADATAYRAFIVENLKREQAQFSTVVTQHWPERRELALFSTPVRDAQGEELGRLYVYRDVTHEREVDRMKSEFVSHVSHELRTPLTSIKGYVELLLEGAVGELGAEQVEFLEIVRANADRLIALINELLDISRLEAGRVELHLAAVDLGSLVRNVAQILRPQIDAKGQNLTLDLAPDLPEVLADANRVTQIVLNLLSNAHKYTPAGGDLGISAQVEPGGSRVRVDVRDNGIGLSVEDQAQLFSKFFRAQNRATREAGGTGLGLTISRSLAEMHGGTLTASSAPGEGSTFSFTLPIVPLPADDARAATPAPDAMPAAGSCILVVEDEPDIARLLQRYLERGGYRVLVAPTGEEALRLATAERPQLITLDLLLPDVDGFTVLDWLKQEPLTAEIPVIFVTSLPLEGQNWLGAIDYLPKPINQSFLLERVHLILGQPGRGTVLVADDDADIRNLIAGLLRQAGYTVSEAADGVEALEQVERARPNLALLDVRMPRLDGVEVLTLLRADPETANMPVVMMTNTHGAMEANRSLVALLGGAALLSKPSTAEELAEAIARGLREASLMPSTTSS